MSAPTDTTLPRPPTLLLDLYDLKSPSDLESHPSLFYSSREDSAHPSPTSRSPTRPFVTLTFAQSLDAKIAGKGGKQLILSGRESMVMTHWMRTLHDAILVGVGTALNDDPQLNTRHLPPLSAGCTHTYRLPRPVILDTRLRLNPRCKLLQNYQAGRGRRPWVVCSPRAGADTFAARADALRQAGAHIVEVDADAETGVISIPALLTALRARGTRSLMVEGGASVIRSFLSAAQGSMDGSSEHTESTRVVDGLVVTVAPVLVGEASVGYGSGLLTENLPTFKHVRTEVFGPDAVTALRMV